MRIDINGTVYEVPEEYINKLAEDLFSLVETIYNEKLDGQIKVGLMAITRTMLVKEEMAVRMKSGKEAARAMRPPPKADPNLWLARQCLPTIQGMLKNARITCQTSTDSITAIGLSVESAGESGRQVDSSGDIGLRENDRAQVS